MKTSILALLLSLGAVFVGASIPYCDTSVDAALATAAAARKLVVVSLGREMCGRCQKFYALMASQQLVFDPAKCTYLKLDVDNLEHREYFYSWVEPPDRRLPYVAVVDPSAGTGTCLSAACVLPELRTFLGPLVQPAP